MSTNTSSNWLGSPILIGQRESCGIGISNLIELTLQVKHLHLATRHCASQSFISVQNLYLKFLCNSMHHESLSLKVSVSICCHSSPLLFLNVFFLTSLFLSFSVGTCALFFCNHVASLAFCCCPFTEKNKLIALLFCFVNVVFNKVLQRWPICNIQIIRNTQAWVFRNMHTHCFPHIYKTRRALIIMEYNLDTHSKLNYTVNLYKL